MASGKERRKRASIDRRLRRPPPSRPRDGDRRRRDVDLARLEQLRKEAERAWDLDVGWTDAPPETDRGRIADDEPRGVPEAAHSPRSPGNAGRLPTAPSPAPSEDLPAEAADTPRRGCDPGEAR